MDIKPTISVRSGDANIGTRDQKFDFKVEIEREDVQKTSTPESAGVRETNKRRNIIWLCAFTLIVYNIQLFNFDHVVIPIFRRLLRWDRIDMSTLLASQLWGAALGHFISTKFQTKDAKWPIVIVFLWAGYFNIWTITTINGFFEIWINRIFFSFSEGCFFVTIVNSI